MRSCAYADLGAGMKPSGFQRHTHQAVRAKRTACFVSSDSAGTQNKILCLRRLGGRDEAIRLPGTHPTRL